MARIRHSKATDALAAMGDDDLDAYRDLAMSKEARLEDMVEFCVARGVSISKSMAHRDRQAFREDARDLELEIERIRARAMVSREMAKVIGEEGLAKLGATNAAMLDQILFDFMQVAEIEDLDDATKVAKVQASMASMLKTMLAFDKAEVERRAREAADKVKQEVKANAGEWGLSPDTLDKLDRIIHGIPEGK